MEQEILISFEGFGFQYTAQAEPTLYDIDLQIRRGEKVLIAGPSGCGKSTLAHCINGLVPNSYPGKTSGTLTVGGKNAITVLFYAFKPCLIFAQQINFIAVKGW